MVIELPEDLEISLRDEVRLGHFASVDDAVVEAVRSFLGRPRSPANGKAIAGETAFDVLDRAGLIGCVEGHEGSPTDLSTNPAHMEGFGRG